MMQHPMVEQVDRLIGNLLAGGGEIFLPGVGSLYTERQGAKRLSRRSVLPPYRLVAFTSQQRGTSLVDQIARVLADAARLEPVQPADSKAGGAEAGDSQLEQTRLSGSSSDGRQPEVQQTGSALSEPPTGAVRLSENSFRVQAQDIYDRWLERTLQNDVLTVAGVGVLKYKHFTLDGAFDRRLNPQGHEPVRIRFGRRFDWALFIGGIALLFAALIGGYEFLTLYSDESAKKVVAERNAARQPAADDGSWIDRALAGQGPDRPDTAADASSARAGESASETAVVSDRKSASAVGDAGTAPAETVPAPTGASASADGEAGGRSASGAVRPSGTEAQVSTGFSPLPLSGGEVSPAALVSGRRYVVLGVFSTTENAARAAREAAEKVPGLSCGIYRFGDKFLVSPFVAEDAEACRRFIRAQAEHFPDMWTYTAR